MCMKLNMMHYNGNWSGLDSLTLYAAKQISAGQQCFSKSTGMFRITNEWLCSECERVDQGSWGIFLTLALAKVLTLNPLKVFMMCWKMLYKVILLKSSLQDFCLKMQLRSENCYDESILITAKDYSAIFMHLF